MITTIQTAVSLLTAVLVVTRAINLQPGSAGRSWVDDYVPITLVYAVAARTSRSCGPGWTGSMSRPWERRRSPPLSCASSHLSFREIGERLYISQHTAKKHATTLYQKLGVSSRSQAVQRARQLGLLGK